MTADAASAAARLEGRGFIGFEKDERAAKAANKRVGEGVAGMTA